ncbi:hypothetical protein BKA81DRAFT_374673 [Phyllosticta paracitricarpa]
MASQDAPSTPQYRQECHKLKFPRRRPVWPRESPNSTTCTTAHSRDDMSSISKSLSALNTGSLQPREETTRIRRRNMTLNIAYTTVTVLTHNVVSPNCRARTCIKLANLCGREERDQRRRMVRAAISTRWKGSDSCRLQSKGTKAGEQVMLVVEKRLMNKWICRYKQD